MKSLLVKEWKIGINKKSNISIFDLQLLSRYVKSGYALQDIAEFMKLDSKLFEQMQTGQNLQSILAESGLSLLAFLLEHLTLDEALDCYLGIVNYRQQFKKNIIKAISYPLVQLVLAFGLSLIAQNWLFPLLKDLLSDMGVNDFGSSWILLIISLVNICLIIGFITIILGWFIFRYFESTILFLLLKNSLLRWLKDIIAQQFAYYYVVFYKTYGSSEQVLMSLRKLPGERLINNFADIMHFQLLTGKKFSTAFGYLDISLQKAFEIGGKTEKIGELLEIYIQSKQDRFQTYTKKIGIIVQTISYCYIGLIVWLVYQLMLMPLAMIERM